MWRLQSNNLKVGRLNTILVRGLIFPALRVLVPNVLCVISALPAYLTDLSHFLPTSRLRVANKHYTRASTSSAI